MMNIKEILTKAADEKFNAEFVVLCNRLSLPGAITWMKTPIYTTELSCLKNPIRFLIGYQYSHTNVNGGTNNIYLIGSNVGRKSKHKRIASAIGSISENTVDNIFSPHVVIAPGAMDATTFRDHVINLPSVAPLFTDHVEVRAQISSILDCRRDPAYAHRINVSSINTGLTLNLTSGGAARASVRYSVHLQHIPRAAVPIILASRLAPTPPWI